MHAGNKTLHFAKKKYIFHIRIDQLFVDYKRMQVRIHQRTLNHEVIRISLDFRTVFLYVKDGQPLTCIIGKIVLKKASRLPGMPN